MRGVVSSEPLQLPPQENPFARWSYGRERTHFLLNVQSVEGPWGDIPVRGRLRVTVGEAVLDLREGEEVEVFGWLQAFRPPANPGMFDWATYHRREGLSAGLFCSQRENVRRLDPHRLARPGLLSRVRAHFRNLLTNDLAETGDDERGLLEALVLGQRSRTDRAMNEMFIRAGCVHFLAVSGVNVGIVMFLAFAPCRLMGLGPRARTWVMLLAVVGYALLTEPRPSVLRATIIAVIYCAARLVGRERAYLNWMAATVVVLACVDPPMVFEVGYQLSTIAVAGVVFLAPALRESLGDGFRWVESRVLNRPHAAADRRLIAYAKSRKGEWSWRLFRARQWSFRWMGTSVVVSGAAWLVTFPVVAWHFERIQPWGALGSLAALPAVTALMGLGFLKLGVTVAAPTAGAALVEPLLTVEAWLLELVGRCAALPGASIRISAPPWWTTASIYLFLLLFIWRRRCSPVETPTDRLSPQTASYVFVRPPRLAVIVAGVLLIFAFTAWSLPPPPPQRLIVTVLSVGAGSATVIELPDGRTVLYDAGGGGPSDVGKTVIVPYLRHRGADRIEQVYISHANLDHFSGLLSVLNEIPTGPIVVNEYFTRCTTDRLPVRFLLDQLGARNAVLHKLPLRSDTGKLGGAMIEYLWPAGEWDDSLSVNDASTVLRICYADRCVMLPGDIDERAQNQLLLRGDLHADVLVLPHHGSVDSTTERFLDAVGANVLIRSSHERREDAVTDLEEVAGQRRLFNTADVGAVRVEIDERGVQVQTSLPLRERDAGA